VKRSYIFLDNWVYPMLSAGEARQRLAAFLLTNDYTVILTSLALTELYNPGWQDANGPDRVERAVSLLSQVPCVIVDPSAIFAAEMDADLQPLTSLPIKFNLEIMEPDMRADVLRRLLRRDPQFLEQGSDIQVWAENVSALKATWLDEVELIIENACRSGYLVRDRSGEPVLPPDGAELFLYSLDFRHAPGDRIDAILRSHLERTAAGRRSMPTAVRLSSLYFLYAYVRFDGGDRIKRQGSDIADMYHLSLATYCAAFTTDKNMHRLLGIIKQSGVTLPCRVMTRVC
jgi:hypothetical protein